MRRTEQVQGLRLMKFEEVYGRTHRGGLSQAEAAEVLGVSERTFRRWRERYEAEGADGLYDRRLGRVSARRAPVDEVARVLELFDTRYWDLTAKHFHEKLVVDSRSAPDHFPTGPNHHNRSGQFIWYIKRSTQFVIDTAQYGPCHVSLLRCHPNRRRSPRHRRPRRCCPLSPRPRRHSRRSRPRPLRHRPYFRSSA